MDSTIIKAAIQQAGGARAVADARGLRSEWGVQKWAHVGVPAEHVIPLAVMTNWETTPHMLSPEIYPSPLDGMPDGVRLKRLKVAAA